MNLSHYPEIPGLQHTRCTRCGAFLSRESDEQAFTDVLWGGACPNGEDHQPGEIHTVGGEGE